MQRAASRANYEATGKTPTRIRRFTGHAALYTLATVAPTITIVVLTPFLTRALPSSEFEMVALAKAVVQVGFTVLSLGLAAAITREYIIESSGARGASGLVFQASTVTSLMALIGLATGPFWSPILLGRRWDLAVALAFLGALGASLVAIVQAFLRGAERPVPFILVASGGSLVGPAVGLVLVTIGIPSASVYLGAVAVGYLVCAAAGLVLIARSAKPEFGWRRLLKNLRIGLPTIPHSIALSVSISGLVVVASRALGDGGAANIVLIFGSGAAMVTGALNNSWAPLIYKTAPEQRLAMLRRSTCLITSLISMIVVVVAVASPYIVRVAAPDTFDRAAMAPAMAIAALGALPNIMYLSSAHLVFADGRTGVLVITSPISIGAALAASVPLSHYFGLIGIGIAYVLAQSLLAILTNVGMRLTTGVGWLPKVPWIPIVCVGAAVVTGFVPYTGAAWTAARSAVAVLCLATLIWRARMDLRSFA